MPDVIVQNGTMRIVKPIDVAHESGGQFSMSNAARTWTAMWLTLRTMGWTPKLAPSRSSPPARVSFTLGKSSLMSTLIPNPRFYELAMGWPIGWSAPGEPVTAYAHWLRRARGRFSRLLTDWTPDENGRI